MVAATFRVRAEPFATLGLVSVPHPKGLGDFIETDAPGETSVPGLNAAGVLFALPISIWKLSFGIYMMIKGVEPSEVNDATAVPTSSPTFAAASA